MWLNMRCTHFLHALGVRNVISILRRIKVLQKVHERVENVAAINVRFFDPVRHDLMSNR